MMEVRIPLNQRFNFDECKEMYEKYQKELEDDTDFSQLARSAFFYSFYEDGNLLGCIYFYEKNGKLFLNGFADRKHHLSNLECLKWSLSWFDCDIYAEGLHKTSRLCLLKSGFKRVKDNLFKYRRK